MFWECLPEWEGETAFIICGGPSVGQQNLELLRGRKVIVINSSVHVVPWADMLFFGDSRWWREAHNRAAAEKFQGIAVTTSNQVLKSKVKIMLKRQPPGLSSARNALTMKRTSLSGAINLAVHRGVRAIVLLGADGNFDKLGRSHHHKPHRWPPRPGCWNEQKKDLLTIVEPLRLLGIKVINASPGSAWADLWPVMNLEDAIVEADRDDVDFTAAETFLSQCRKSYENGDVPGFIANRKMAMLALGIPDPAPPPRK